MKSRYRVKRVNFYFFSPGPRPGHVKVGTGQMGYFLVFSGAVLGHLKSRCRINARFSIIFGSGPRPGHVKSRYGANGVRKS